MTVLVKIIWFSVVIFFLRMFGFNEKLAFLTWYANDDDWINFEKW